MPAGEARYTRASLFLGIALAAALFATPTAAIEFVGKIVGVTGGDTITVLVERRAIKVRLAEIDPPEKGQPYGCPAKQALSDLVFGKVGTMREQTRDRYGCTVGHDGRIGTQIGEFVERCVAHQQSTQKALALSEAHHRLEQGFAERTRVGQ